MKQNITYLQWKEIPFNIQARFQRSVGDKLAYAKGVDRIPEPSIGQMIEFLGDDWYIEIMTGVRRQEIGHKEGLFLGSLPDNKDLCNELWEAVKEKLTK